MKHKDHVRKTQLVWVFLTWSLCFIAFHLWPLSFVPWFLCFSLLSLGVALHYIHAFHSRCFFFLILYKKRRKEGKGSTLCSCTKKEEGKKRKHIVFLHYSLYFWKQGWSIYFHITCLLYFLFSFDEFTFYTLLVETL